MFRKIFELIRLIPYKRVYLAILFFEVGKAVLSTFLEPFGLQMVGDGIVQADSSMLYRGLAILIPVMFLTFFTFYFLRHRLDVLLKKNEVFLRHNFIKIFLSNPASTSVNSDDVFSRLTSDAGRINQFYNSLYNTLSSVFGFLTAVYAGMLLSWQLCLIVLILGLLKIWVNKAIIGKLSEVIDGIVVIHSKMLSNILELAEGSALIRLLNQSASKRRFRQFYASYETTYQRETTYQVKLSTINSLLDMATIIIILALGSVFAVFGVTSLGTLMAFLVMQDTLTNPITFIGDFIKDFKYVIVSYDRYVSGMGKKENAAKANMEISVFTEEISVEDLVFAYPDQPRKLFEHFNMKLAPGEITYILGASGTGKTTLLKLLMGILKPDSGEIRYKTDAGSLDAGSVPICYVSQNPIFIKGTIAENIALSFYPDPQRLRLSMEKSKFIDVMQKKDTPDVESISARGTNLSKGQRDRLAMARAFYHESQIMIFDEVFSSIDNSLISEIAPWLNALSEEKKIVVVVSHRQEWIPDDVKKIVLGSCKS